MRDQSRVKGGVSHGQVVRRGAEVRSDGPAAVKRHPEEVARILRFVHAAPLHLEVRLAVQPPLAIVPPHVPVAGLRAGQSRYNDAACVAFLARYGVVALVAAGDGLVPLQRLQLPALPPRQILRAQPTPRRRGGIPSRRRQEEEPAKSWRKKLLRRCSWHPCCTRAQGNTSGTMKATSTNRTLSTCVRRHTITLSPAYHKIGVEISSRAPLPQARTAGVNG